MNLKSEMITTGPVLSVSCLWLMSNVRHLRKQTELGCSSRSSAALLCKVQESHGERRVSCYAAGEWLGKYCKGPQLRYWRQTRKGEIVLNSNEKAADLDGA